MHAQHEQTRLARSVADGISFVARHRELRGLTLGMASFNLGYATLVLFAQEGLGLDARGLGVLLAMLAVGGPLAGWLAPRLSGRVSTLRMYAGCLLGQGVAWAAVALAETAVVAGAALVVVSLASMTATVISAAARQSLTGDHMLSRMSAGTRVVGLGAAGLGAIAGCGLADFGTLSTPLLVAAVVAATLASVFVWPRDGWLERGLSPARREVRDVQ